MPLQPPDAPAKKKLLAPPSSNTAEMEKMRPVEEKLDEDNLIQNFQSYFPSITDLDEYEKIAEWMVKRGYGVRDTAGNISERQKMDLEMQLMYCKALNLPAVFAKSIYVIDGKPELENNAMMWLITRGCPTAEFETVEYGEDKVTIRARRNSKSPWFAVTWTTEKAKVAIKGFAKKDVWKNIRPQMLRSRCYGELGRALFFREIKGAYAAGEISDNAPKEE